MSNQEIIEYNGVEYVRVLGKENSCYGCVFYKNRKCIAPDIPIFRRCKEKFIWKEKNNE